MKKVFLALFLLFMSPSLLAFAEFKTNFYGSFLVFGRSDVLLSTHNTFLLGNENLKMGAFYSYETYQENTKDSSFGGAVRYGETSFLELQAGAFKRNFEAHTTLKGKGISANIIIGKHFGEFFGISLMVSGKKINAGLSKRLIMKVLPYFGLRARF